MAVLAVSNIAPFPVIPHLQAIAIAYTNQKLIADLVLPRIQPVPVQAFAWLELSLKDGFFIPDTKVGRKSDPNEVETSADIKQDKTQDYYLRDWIPYEDITNAAVGYDPQAHAVEWLMYLIRLDRERRVAGLVHNAAMYPASNKVVLSGTSQFSDYVNSDPISVLKAAMDAMIMRPNKMVIGRPAWSVLQSHPKVLKAVYRNLGDSGSATKEEVAAVLELDEIIVGEAWFDTTKRGQAPSLSRIWGKNLSLHYVNPLANNQRGVTYGYTVPWGMPQAGGKWEEKKGAHGAMLVQAGESVKEVIAAPACGYFMQNVVG